MTTEKSERKTFLGGNPKSHHGFPIRCCNGGCPDPAQAFLAAEILNREVIFVDEEGYKCEIIAATVHPSSDHKRIIYVESRAKKLDRCSVDVSIKINLVDLLDGTKKSVDIETHNPYFGCNVAFLEWYGEVALLIYREKTRTYVYRIGDEKWPPQFAEIGGFWQLDDDEGALSFRRYRGGKVMRLKVPSLDQLPSDSSKDEPNDRDSEEVIGWHGFFELGGDGDY